MTHHIDRSATIMLMKTYVFTSDSAAFNFIKDHFVYARQYLHDLSQTFSAVWKFMSEKISHNKELTNSNIYVCKIKHNIPGNLIHSLAWEILTFTSMSEFQ